MIKMIQILADESDTNPFKGAFSGWQGTAGIVLIVVGLLMIYFGVKVIMGYRFMPEQTATIILEDKYVKTTAKVLEQEKTLMPSFNGGEPSEFVEWKISYEVEGESYTQMIPDNEYHKGDFLDIKYNPDNPKEYYLDEGHSDVQTAPEDLRPDEKKSPVGYVIIAVAIMIIVIGLILAM